MRAQREDRLHVHRKAVGEEYMVETLEASKAVSIGDSGCDEACIAQHGGERSMGCSVGEWRSFEPWRCKRYPIKLYIGNQLVLLGVLAPLLHRNTSTAEVKILPE